MKWMRFRILVGLVFAFCWGNSSAQDLFNYKNSKAFADYLYNTRRYPEAVNEYQRIVFMQSGDTASWINLVRSFQAQELYSPSLAFADSAEANIGNVVYGLGYLKSYSLLKVGAFSEIDGLFDEYSFKNADKEFVVAARKALQGEWNYFQDDFNMTNQRLAGRFKAMAEMRDDFKRKSPFVAGVFSAVVPGTGKIYAGRWKDGLFSTVLFAASAWQAYRIISRKGIDTFGGVFFGGLAAGFYTGNVYGSVKAAMEHNDALEIKLRDETNHLVDMYFGY